MKATLAFNMATNIMSLALSYDDKIYTFEKDTGPKQTDIILPQIDALLKEAHLSIGDVDTIVYSMGPGSFTGLRVGLAVAQGLAISQGIKLVPIPTLDAFTCFNDKTPYTLAIMDARMGEFFWAWYNNEEPNKTLNGYHVSSYHDIQIPDDLDLSLAYGIGNAYSEKLNVSDKLPIKGCSDMPTAVDYLKLYQQSLYKPLSVTETDLLYVRNKVALTQKEQQEKFHK